jgi:hypothetical protein
MLRGRGLADVKWCSDLGDGRLTIRQSRQDRPPGRIRQCREDGVQVGRRLRINNVFLNYMVLLLTSEFNRFLGVRCDRNDDMSMVAGTKGSQMSSKQISSSTDEASESV